MKSSHCVGWSTGVGAWEAARGGCRVLPPDQTNQSPLEQAISLEHVTAEHLAFKGCSCLAWISKTNEEMFQGLDLTRSSSNVRNRVVMSFLQEGRETGMSQRWFGVWVERKMLRSVYCSTEANKASEICHPGAVTQKDEPGFGTETQSWKITKIHSK